MRWVGVRCWFETRRGVAVDVQPTTEQELLRHAERQTAALESLRGIALVWTALVVLGIFTWVFVTFAS